MDPLIRNANEGDLDSIERIEKQCFSVPWTRGQIQSQLPDDTHIFIVTVDDEGIVMGYVNAMCAADEGYISNVAVSADFRRLGIGDRLIEKLVDVAGERDLKFLTLEARISNLPAISLYKKHGFSDVGVRKNYYEKPREDAILMTLFLK